MRPSVLVTGGRAPVALHWCRLFSAANWRVVVADSLKSPLARFSRLVDCYEQFPSPQARPKAFSERVEQIVDFHKIDVVLPTCEEVFHLAAAAEGKAWASKLFAPSLETLLSLHDKARFNAMVAEIAPSFAPAFHRLESPAQVAAVPGDHWVFKPCFSRFGTETVICPSMEQRAHILPTSDAPWVAQSYLPGEELCCSAIVHEGRLVAMQAYLPVVRLRNGTGAGIAFEAADEVHYWAIEPMIAALAKALNITGQLSFDFRKDAAGKFKVLECNPRSTSGFHFFGPKGGLVQAVVEGRETLVRAPKGRFMGERLPTLLIGGWAGLRTAAQLRSLSRWPGDTLSPLDQLRSFVELLRIARQNKCSVEAASTLDIRWNFLQKQ